MTNGTGSVGARPRARLAGRAPPLRGGGGAAAFFCAGRAAAVARRRPLDRGVVARRHTPALTASRVPSPPLHVEADQSPAPMPDPSPDDPLLHVREGYDRWAHVYDHDGNPLIGLEDPAVRDAAGAVQLVVSGLVLEHLPDLGHFFGEARRVLRPGGRAVVSAMHPAMFLR